MVFTWSLGLYLAKLALMRDTNDQEAWLYREVVAQLLLWVIRRMGGQNDLLRDRRCAFRFLMAMSSEFACATLTHWVRPGIQSASSWILVGFFTTWQKLLNDGPYLERQLPFGEMDKMGRQQRVFDCLVAQTPGSPLTRLQVTADAAESLGLPRLRASFGFFLLGLVFCLYDVTGQK